MWQVYFGDNLSIGIFGAYEIHLALRLEASLMLVEDGGCFLSFTFRCLTWFLQPYG